MNIIGNLYVSNGMSAGNTKTEARTQGLSEVFERHVKNKIIAEALSLPEIPSEVIARYPGIKASIEALEAEGFPIYSFDASLGGRYPVICVVLLNPSNGTCFASFGAHPRFEVAFERPSPSCCRAVASRIWTSSCHRHSTTSRWRITTIWRPTSSTRPASSAGICSSRSPTSSLPTGTSAAPPRRSSIT